MSSFLISLLAKLTAFALSIVLGMLGFICYQGFTASSPFEATTPDVSQIIIPHQTTELNAEPVLLATTENPVDVSFDQFGNLFVLQQDGEIVKIPSASLEVSGSVANFAQLADEFTHPGVGFRSIALHPDFLNKDTNGYGKFYVVVGETPENRTPDFVPEFTSNSFTHHDVIYEYTCENPYLGNFTGNRRELLRFAQPGADHNVSSLAFDPYGSLFISVGDGSSGPVNSSSISKNASSLTSAYGKVLKIDPLGDNSSNGKYGIPPTNPFRMVSDSLPEIWAFGLRAPHSLSFDVFQNRLSIADEGIDGMQKIQFSEMGAEHFGWDFNAGRSLLDFAYKSQLSELVTAPRFTFDSSTGAFERAAGNLIYRGENFPALAGRMIVASENGKLILTSPNQSTQHEVSLLKPCQLPDERISALRSNGFGEMIVISESGKIYEIRKRTSLGDGKKRTRKLYCELQREESSSEA